MKFKQKMKLIIVLGIEFLAIAAMLLLIFFAGKKVYTVTFDLNGGTLLSGDVVQKVTQGQNANPPTVTKEGCYFLKWEGSYREITKDTTIKAIWEYETSYGIEYTSDVEGYNSNYCEISGCYDGLSGDIYIGAYHNGKKVLGIKENAFANCEGITSIHLLDGILKIEAGAFKGCTNLVSIEMPSTVITMEDSVFEGCESLESIILPNDLKKMGNKIFKDCTSLKEVTFGDNLETIGKGAFLNCSSLESVSLPDSLLLISDEAFKNCVALVNVTLGESLEEIGAKAFSNCKLLKEIILPKSLLIIGSSAFDQEDLKIYVCINEEEKPDTWVEDWNANNAEVIWGYVEEESKDENDESLENSDIQIEDSSSKTSRE